MTAANPLACRSYASGRDARPRHPRVSDDVRSLRPTAATQSVVLGLRRSLLGLRIDQLERSQDGLLTLITVDRRVVEDRVDEGVCDLLCSLLGS